MGMIAIALAMAAQGAPPPPVRFENQRQLNQFLEGFPCFEDRGEKHCVLSVIVSGKKKDMEAAKLKLTGEGWPSTYRTERSGKTILDVDPKNRTLDEAWALTNRFSSKEFGALQAEFLSIPASGAK